MTKSKLPKRKPGRPANQAKLDLTKVLEVALQLFAQKGFDGTRVNEIAEKSGCSKSLMNYHFKTKEELWQKAVTQLGEKLAERYQGIEGYFKDLEGVALMKAFNRQFIYFSAEYPEFYKIIFHEMCNPSSRSKWLLDHILGPLHQMTEVRVREAVDGETVLANISSAHLFSLLIGAANVFFIHAYQNKQQYGINVFDQKEIEQYADFVNETVFARFK